MLSLMMGHAFDAALRHATKLVYARRVVTRTHVASGICHYLSTGALSGPYPLPYSVGDRLWVREAWRAAMQFDATKPRDIPQSALIVPEASADIRLGGKLRPGMFMPRWASRLTLIVTDVRVQRLQEISEADATAEGVSPDPCANELAWQHYVPHAIAFERLWDSLARPGATWADNPWVAAITFETHHCNIDAMEVTHG